MVGTATGSIIALALAAGVPAADPLTLYRKRGREISRPVSGCRVKYASVATPPSKGNLWPGSGPVFRTTANSAPRAVAGAYPRWTGTVAMVMFAKHRITRITRKMVMRRCPQLQRLLCHANLL